MALRSGREIRTPAKQADLVDKQLTFPDVFTALAGFLLLIALAIRVRCWRQGPVLGLAALQQHLATEAPIRQVRHEAFMPSRVLSNIDVR